MQKPQTFPELQKAAMKHFGRHQQLRLLHLGKKQLQHQWHMDNILHDDNVVVDWADFSRPVANLTTHQEYFIEHPCNPEAPFDPSRGAPACVPFQGTSSYREDFVRHRLGERRKKAAQATWRALPGSIGRSTYAADYYERPLPSRRPPPPPEALIDSGAFTGRSRYNTDFVAHAVRPRSEERQRSARPMLPRSFDGRTTYRGDYDKKPVRPQTTPRIGFSTPVQGIPFVSDSEYRREFLQKKSDGKEYIHLEPAVGL